MFPPPFSYLSLIFFVFSVWPAIFVITLFFMSFCHLCLLFVLHVRLPFLFTTLVFHCCPWCFSPFWPSISLIFTLHVPILPVSTMSSFMLVSSLSLSTATMSVTFDDTTSWGACPVDNSDNFPCYLSLDLNQQSLNLMSGTLSTMPTRQPRRLLEKLFVLCIKKLLVLYIYIYIYYIEGWNTFQYAKTWKM